MAIAVDIEHFVSTESVKNAKIGPDFPSDSRQCDQFEGYVGQGSGIHHRVMEEPHLACAAQLSRPLADRFAPNENRALPNRLPY